MSTPTTHSTAKDSAELHARQAANSEWLNRACTGRSRQARSSTRTSPFLPL